RLRRRQRERRVPTSKAKVKGFLPRMLRKAGAKHRAISVDRRWSTRYSLRLRRFFANLSRLLLDRTAARWSVRSNPRLLHVFRYAKSRRRYAQLREVLQKEIPCQQGRWSKTRTS